MGYKTRLENLLEFLISKGKEKENNLMSEESKVAEEVKEINPIDEYMNRYKEQRLAEFCVQKDKEIQNYKEERLRFIEQIADMRHKIEKYEKSWDSVDALYAGIKKLSVDDYLRLYHMFSENVSGNHRISNVITTTSDLHYV